MFLLRPKFLSLVNLQPLRYYKKLDGWLLGFGDPIRIKTKKREIWIKHTSQSQWIINPLLYTSDHWQLLCMFCGGRADILYFVDDYRCRMCTKHRLPQNSISGQIRAKRQASIGDYSMLSSISEDWIAMRLHLESVGIVDPLLTPPTEQEAIDLVRYERCVEPSLILEPIKPGRLIWVGHRYIWVRGPT